jgi:hypothetical protein
MFISLLLSDESPYIRNIGFNHWVGLLFGLCQSLKKNRKEKVLAVQAVVRLSHLSPTTRKYANFSCWLSRHFAKLKSHLYVSKLYRGTNAQWTNIYYTEIKVCFHLTPNIIRHWFILCLHTQNGIWMKCLV